MTDFDAPVLDEQGLPVPDPDFEAKQDAKIHAWFDAAAAGEDYADDEPVMYATDPGWFRDLSERIPGLLVHSAGGMLPFQSEGTLHGFPYYFRYRHGYAQLRVMDPNVNEDEATLFEHLYSAGMDYGDEYGGILDRDEFCTLMITLVPQLERGAFLWEFVGIKVNVEDIANEPGPSIDEQILNRHDKNWAAEQKARRERRKPPILRFTATDEPMTYQSWGTTPTEAYARLHEPSQWLVEKGWSVEDQRTNDRLKAIDPIPVNEDTRVFPDPEPVFTVRDA